MAENVAPHPTTNGDAPGLPFYEKSRQQLKELLNKKRQLERTLAQREDAILQKETEYLENTINGNIITGFDNYTKGTTSAAAQRRKTGTTEANRVFSRSSISYNATNQPDAAQTPGSINSAPGSHAPTPQSASFGKDTGSNHPTPTSATGGANSKAGASKKKKKGAAAAAAAADGVDDSETDTRETKKVRTNFGAVKKS